MKTWIWENFFHSVRWQLFLLLCLFIVYIPSLTAPFQLDDQTVISALPRIGEKDFLFQLWSFDPSRFLTHLSLAINFAFSEYRPLSYHCVNLLIHILNVMIVTMVFRSLMDDFQVSIENEELFLFLTAGLFALHPIQTSAVTYVVQRAALLATLCYLLTFVCYSVFRREGRVFFFWLAVLFNFLGLMTKPIIFTLPLALLAYEVFMMHRNKESFVWIPFLKRWTPFVGLALLVPVFLSLWRYQSLDLSSVMAMSRESGLYSRYEYFLTQTHVVVYYLKMIIWPHGQRLDYDWPVATLLSPSTILSFGVLILMLLICIGSFRRSILVSFAILWFFISLSLESSIFPIKDLIFEHRLYLPMAGAAAVIGWGLVRMF